MALKDSRIVITGAASGIGRATANAANGAGARVIGLDLVDPGIDGVEFHVCDVSRPEDWARVSDPAGVPDHLFLNAGVMSAPTGSADDAYAFDSVDLDGYRKLVGVNIDGVVLGLKTFLAKMTAGSSIVVTASIAGVVAYAYDPLYAMTKHAVVGLVRSLAPVLAQRFIVINALCPGGVDTAIIPTEMRGTGPLMSPDSLAAEACALFETTETGGAWAKVVDDKPAFVIQPPGQRGRKDGV